MYIVHAVSSPLDLRQKTVRLGHIARVQENPIQTSRRRHIVKFDW